MPPRSLAPCQDGDVSVFVRGFFVQHKHNIGTCGGGNRCQQYQNSIFITEKKISGQKFREWMELKSAFFTLNWNAQEQVWQCQGHGNGHGVGLCQYGAQAMATKGYTYGAILLHYYPGASLYKLW